VCLSASIVIEIDGGQHAGSAYDATRDAELNGRGFRVLRFWNNEVLDNTEGVCEMILRHASDLRPHPDLPPHAGEGDKP
jgi:very-short-patch-repair endonuclease